MMTKSVLEEQIKDFPEEFSVDELIEKLILIKKIESGNSQSINGKVVTDSELENEIETWFK